MPPPIVAKILGNLTEANSGLCINALKSVLTPGKILIFGCFFNSFMNPSKSRGLGTKTNRPPLRIPNTEQAVKAKM